MILVCEIIMRTWEHTFVGYVTERVEEQVKKPNLNELVDEGMWLKEE